MKKKLIAAVALAVLYGCAGEPAKEEPKAGVEERTPGAAQKPAPAVRPPAAAQPVTPPRVKIDPLKDPSNILSKRSIFYDYDKDEIKPEFRPLIEAHGKYLAQNKGAKMLIQGNCDERGSREYNIALGQRRADGVKRLLLLMGASESQIESVSLGEEKPRCNSNTEECYAQNRRSDMLYSGEY
ncbi:MAG: peptidoglycan-associated lipoprotein Pal [Betaproteobacteria bacterium]|nr:peptidoglycan-associated lipoprotein Pal [Betaproteobacteria bacterium]MBI2959887.1 peptidoglycan-associated lipoprotein Pal [Betaproteobacteria bacterium]